MNRLIKKALSLHSWPLGGSTEPEGHDIEVLTLVKGSDRYLFLYDEDSRAAALRTLGRFASDPELNFTWYDAAVLSLKIRQEAENQEE